MIPFKKISPLNPIKSAITVGKNLSEPAGKASEPAGRASEPAGRKEGRGGRRDEEEGKTRLKE